MRELWLMPVVDFLQVFMGLFIFCVIACCFLVPSIRFFFKSLFSVIEYLSRFCARASDKLLNFVFPVDGDDDD